MPTNSLLPRTARLAMRTPVRTRRTRMWRSRASGRGSGMGCKLVNPCPQVNTLVGCPQQGPLQVSRLRHVQELGVIPAGSRPCEELQAAPAVLRRGREHRREVLAVYVVGAAAGEEDPARREQPHGAQVDLFV